MSAELIADAEAIITTFRIPRCRGDAKAMAIDILPRLVAALRQRPGRAEVERRLRELEEEAHGCGAGGEYGLGASDRDYAKVEAKRNDLLTLLCPKGAE